MVGNTKIKETALIGKGKLHRGILRVYVVWVSKFSRFVLHFDFDKDSDKHLNTIKTKTF